MTTKVKSKIVRLLQDLDLHDNSSPETLLLNQGAVRTEGEGNVASGAWSDSDEASDTTDTDRDSLPGQRRHQQDNDKVQFLERRVMQLMHDNKALHLQHEHAIKKKDQQVAELQVALSTAVSELRERQHEVEAKAPIFKAQMEELRGRLRDLKISEEQYHELKGMPADHRHVLDEVKMALFEALAELRRDNERLRLANAAARESAARAEEEAARLRSENARLAAAAAEQQRDAQQGVVALQARAERLASELEQALLKVELNGAKAEMYDELRAKAAQLEAENQQLQVVEATAKRFEAHAHDMQLLAKEKEHTFEMLMMDKAYLSKQVEFLSEQARKAEAELAQRDKLVLELQRSKQELVDRLVALDAGRGRPDEVQLHKEIGRLQAAAQADLERVRTEMAEAYEREARLLRELRDQAAKEASSARIALTELQDVHEKCKINSAELQRRLEGHILELQGELKQRAFELAHAKVVGSERESLLQRASMQAELLQDKLQVVLERNHRLEAELQAAAAAAGRHPQAAGLPPQPPQQQQQQALPAATAGTSRGSGAVGSGAAGGAAVVAVAGAALPVEQQVQLLVLRQEREHLTAQVASLQAEVRAAHEALKLAGQPHSFLLEELRAAKLQAQQAQAAADRLQATLKDAEDEAVSLRSEKQALRRDLDALLAQRAQLDAMRQMVARALGSQGGSAGLGLRQPHAPVGATTVHGGA